MKIIVISRFRPGRPDGGGALRNLQNIRALSALGDVDVLSVSDEEEESETFEGVADWKHVRLKEGSENKSCVGWLERVKRLILHRVHPALARYVDEEAVAWLKERFREQRYDLGVVEELSLARYVPILKKEGCPVVFDAHNVEGVLRGQLDAIKERSLSTKVKVWIREKLFRQGLGEEERLATKMADVVWACSEEDQMQLQKCYGVQSVVVPNGLRVEDYKSFHDEALYGGEWSEQPVRMIFIGRYGYYPNEDAALRLMREVLPCVRAMGRKAKLVLVGMSPTERMMELAQGDADIEVTGGVESVQPYLEEPCIATFPIAYGSGTRLKILEAFAVARAVVTTAKGAEGIAARDGQELFIRETPEECAKAVVTLWDDRQLRLRMCQQGLKLLQGSYSWQVAERLIRESLVGCSVDDSRASSEKVENGGEPVVGKSPS